MKSGVEVSARRYRYTGKERDDETGLYLMGARYYACWLARWTAADPAGTVDGTNLYAYVRGSPVGLVDPSGTSGLSAVGKAFSRFQKGVAAYARDVQANAAKAGAAENLLGRKTIDATTTVQGWAGSSAKARIQAGVTPGAGAEGGQGSGPGDQDPLYVAPLPEREYVPMTDPSPIPLSDYTLTDRQIDARARQANARWSGFNQRLEGSYGSVGFGEGVTLAALLGNSDSERLLQAGEYWAGAAGAFSALAVYQGAKREKGGGGAPPPAKPPSTGGSGGPPRGSGNGGAPPRVIGLGLDKDLHQHAGTGAITWKQGGWQRAGLTRIDEAKALLDVSEFKASFRQAAHTADAIRFDVTSYDPAHPKPGVTQYELEYIRKDPRLLNKTTFTMGGQEAHWDGSKFTTKTP